MLRRRSSIGVFGMVLFFAVACNRANDETITTQIKAKMYSEALLKSATVTVASKDGIVTLSGVVPDDAARMAAREIASKTDGVKQVIDATNMAPPTPAPAEIAEAPEVPARPEPKPTPPKPARKPKSAPAPLEASEATPPASPASEVSAPAAPPPPPAAAALPSAPVPPPAPPPPQPVTVTIPEGSIVTIRTIQAIDSSTSATGQIFRASLDAPVVVNDSVVLPKGLDVNLKLVDASSAGSFKGRSELTISLDSLTYQGKTYLLQTSDVQRTGASRGKRSAAVIGGGAALGALIGGLAGGGKGAAIGAGVGAGGGTAVQAATKGQQVKIPSETRLDFTLHAAIPVTYIPAKRVAYAPNPAQPAATSQGQNSSGASTPPPADQSPSSPNP